MVTSPTVPTTGQTGLSAYGLDHEEDRGSPPRGLSVDELLSGKVWTILGETGAVEEQQSPIYFEDDVPVLRPFAMQEGAGYLIEAYGVGLLIVKGADGTLAFYEVED